MNQTKNLLLTATVALLFTACGGDDDTPAASDQLTITAANQSAVSALVFDSIDENKGDRLL